MINGEGGGYCDINAVHDQSRWARVTTKNGEETKTGGKGAKGTTSLARQTTELFIIFIDSQDGKKGRCDASIKEGTTEGQSYQ